MCFQRAFRGCPLSPPPPRLHTPKLERIRKSRWNRNRSPGRGMGAGIEIAGDLLFSADIGGGFPKRRIWRRRGREPWRMTRRWKDRSRSETICGFRWESRGSRGGYRRGNWISWLVIIWESIISSWRKCNDRWSGLEIIAILRRVDAFVVLGCTQMLY